MKKLFIIFAILFFAVSAHGATYSVCSSGCDYSTIAGVNTANFADGDIIEFAKDESFTDANLTLAGITSPSGKSITIQASSTGTALPIIGYNSTYIRIDKTGLNLTIKDINIDGQEYADNFAKLTIIHANNVTLDNIEADGSVGYDTGCTENVDCAEKRGIWISASSGTVEIKNCTIENWGGDEDLWGSPAVPAGTGSDASCLNIAPAYPDYDSITSGTLSIHDNTITNCESDGIILEDVWATSLSIYDNTIWNGGENAVDIKGSEDINVYRNKVGRDATFTGLGGSSTGEDETKQGLIQVLTRPTHSSDGVNIYHNRVGPSDTAGIAVRPVDSGYGVTNVDIYLNNIRNTAKNLYTAQPSGTSISNITWWGNVLDGCTSTGYLIYDDDEDATVSSLFYNNTLYVNSDQSPTLNAYVYLKDSDASFINNIFYANDSDDYILFVDSGSNPTFNHNAYYNADAGDDDIISYKGTVYDEGELTTGDNWQGSHAGAVFDNPDLNDPANDDFTPTAPSPCIDAGSTLGGAYDDGFDWGNTTWDPISVEIFDQDVYGSGWEIGACVYGAGDPLPDTAITTSDYNAGGITVTIGGAITPTY